MTQLIEFQLINIRSAFLDCKIWMKAENKLLYKSITPSDYLYYASLTNDKYAVGYVEGRLVLRIICKGKKEPKQKYVTKERFMQMVRLELHLFNLNPQL